MTYNPRDGYLFCNVCKQEKPDAEMSGPNNLRKRGRRSGECKNCKRGRYPRDPENTRAWALKYNYGITSDDYKRMLDVQHGACAICGRVPSYRLHVDHDHETGAIRGLLCVRCNNFLEWFIANRVKTEKYLSAVEAYVQ